MPTNNKLSISYIAPRFRPFRGGGEENIYALASRMALEGHDVTVFTTTVKFRDEKPTFREEMDGMKIVRNWGPTDQLYAGFYPSLLPMILKTKADVIHTSGIGFFWREFCLIVKKVFSPRTLFITTPHGPFMALNDTKGIRGLAKKYGTKLLRLYINWLYDIFVAVNPTQYKWMAEEYGINKKKIVVVPNGINKSMLESELVEHKEDEKVVITFIGRMEWYKGAQNVITALYNLKQNVKNLPTFEFVIMGRSGNYTQKLKDMISGYKMENEVKLIYSPTDEQRDQILYEQSQITILPSKWEATGIALIDAMSKGNAIITTKENEGKDLLIKEGVSGFSYDFADIHTLEDILGKLFTDFELRSKIRKHNLEFARSFTWEAIFPSYVNIIMESKKIQRKRRK